MPMQEIMDIKRSWSFKRMFSVQTNVFLVSEVVFYLAGLIPNILLWAGYYLTPRGSAKLRTVQNHLRSIDRYWSRDLNKIISVLKSPPVKNYKYELIASVMLIFMSWVGMIFSIILIYSLKFMHSRIEQKLINTPLSKPEKLPPESIKKILTENLIEF